jgi:hypothetical protein
MNDAFLMETVGLTLNNERPLEAVLDFLASRAKRPARELSEPAGGIFKGVAEVVDQLLLNVVEKRTADDFRAAFADAFPKYATMTLALSHFARVTVPSDVIDRLTRESICEMEADFRDKALLAFGAAGRDQAMFTVWTLRKINDLLATLPATKLDESKIEEDRKYCREFNVHTLIAHFSLDCLNMALGRNLPIYPEVMSELVNGLRSMVNAYAWARRGVELRVSALEPTLQFSTPNASADAEDEELLSASMLDMAALTDDEPPLNAD